MPVMEPRTVPRSDNAPVELLYGPRVELPTGLVLGSVDRAGCMWVIDTLEGWGQVGSTGTYTQRSYRHGAWVDRAFYPPRILVITGRIHAPNAGTMADRYAAVSSAVDRLLGSIPFDTPDEVVVTEGGRSRLVRARQDGEQFADIQDPGDTATFSLQLVAPDPRRLSAGPEHTASTGLPSSSGGLVIRSRPRESP